jgi:hydrogenase/urease accessory protein HupE
MSGLLRSMRMAAAVLIAALAAALMAPPAEAHELSMAELQVYQTGRGEFQFYWGAGEKSQPASSLYPQWPANCRPEADALHCGEDGLTGTLSIKGVGDRFSAVVLKIHWSDGQTRVYTLTSGQPSVRLFGSAEDQRSMAEVARAYLVLGVEHILSGFDHLLFVISLLFLVGFQRRLVWTVTAFTAAHSITLALAALGWLTLRPPPVEACIALSIVLVAGEALRDRQTLARRMPALVAFIFGLVHGLGFAGALKEFGLPENHLPVALLTFNLGVEAGQLLTVGLAWLLVLGLRRMPWAARLKLPVLYGIGSVAAYWSWLRVAAIVG